MKPVTLCICLAAIAPLPTWAECRNVWADHDYDATTPVILRQVCDGVRDVPAINPPGLQPIQEPQIRPVEQSTLAPIGTTHCRTEAVYEHGRWVDEQICR